MAELSVGGLNFVRSADVAMESEVLSISPQNIVVTYQFRNLTSQPVTAQIAFPLPDLDLSDPDLNLAIPSSDPLNFIRSPPRSTARRSNSTCCKRPC